ncbi:hypothetical protein Tco_0404034 [Tanacetum coccineum]
MKSGIFFRLMFHVFYVLMKEDGKISLRDLKESGDDANVDDDTTTSSKSLDSSSEEVSSSITVLNSSIHASCSLIQIQ